MRLPSLRSKLCSAAEYADMRHDSKPHPVSACHSWWWRCSVYLDIMGDMHRQALRTFCLDACAVIWREPRALYVHPLLHWAAVLSKAVTLHGACLTQPSDTVPLEG